MIKIRITAIATALLVASGLPGIATAQDTAQNATFDKTFLSDYTKLTFRKSAKGPEYGYIAPGALEKLANYTGVMVDQPEVIISPQSDYKGAKPDDLKAVAEAMRKATDDRLKAGGYNMVDAPGPGILYVRIALTDLELKKKKRGLLGYTPIGAVVKFGADALKDMMEKYDIMNMTLQMEVVDSQTRAVFAQYVALRGGGEKPVRIDFDKLNADMTQFGERLRCRLDNAHGPKDKQIDCLDPAARAAREGGAAK